MKTAILLFVLALLTGLALADGQNNNCPNNQVTCGYKQCCVP